MTSPKAAALRALHVPGDPLVLPNVWDAVSARAVQEAGFAVVATGSAAIARVLGYEDGEAAPVAEMLAAVARIARVVDVPVTADVERGYGLKASELVERLLATGAVGCNLEDSDPRTGRMVDPDEQAAYLAEVRAAAAGDLVINARVDTFVYGPRTQEDAVARAHRYLAAGADCVYPILAPDPAPLAAAIDGPMNVIYLPDSPPLSELAAMGVARVSFGHGLHAAAHTYAVDLFTRVREGRNPYQ
ncbi:isocitrate lyase/phosphoenolpyruvate mutase family protein [Nonomuraea sp. NPDC050790]|uniref:isocitrate lyase/phosphoenolpyruvate mutase family protein n=1 Tax=Nonomuraea sp. NPDC050790 TaxID=3364371 RepID=UPI0037952554